MNIEPSYPKCDETSIQNITNLVDAQIQQSDVRVLKQKKHHTRIKNIILAATLALLSLSSLAFASNIDFPNFLRQAYNQLFANESMASKALSYMQPLEGFRIFNGIKAEMIGYIRDNDVTYLTFSLQDLEGDRLDENTFIYDYTLHAYDSDDIDLYGENSVYSFDGGINILHTSPINMPEIALVNYDATTKTATFNYRFSNHDATTFLEDGSREFYKKLELTLNLIASGAKEGEAFFDFSSIPTEDVFAPSTLQAYFDDFRRSGYAGYSEQLQTFLVPDKTALTFLNVPGVVISNYGIIDDRLHVLIKYERPRDVSINRILDMTLKSSQKVWAAKSNVYLKDDKYTGIVCQFMTNNTYYAEYIFDLPPDYTADDLQVLYHYRTYDYIMGMANNAFMNLQESEANAALWKLDFNPAIALKEHTIPFKIESNGKVTKETVAYISSIGLMIPQPSDTYPELGYRTFTQNMALTLLLDDGTSQPLLISNVTGYTKLDQTGKTKFLFSEFVDIAHIKEVKLTLP